MDALDLALQNISEQGSQRWYDIRTGRFTSSEMYRLIKTGERLMTEDELKARPKSGPGSKSKWIEDPSKLSADGETYIYEKVAEVLTGQPKPQIFSYATRHGEEMEPIAAQYYEEITGLKVEPIAFVPVGDHAGGSPDRAVGDKILEIKCPYNPVQQVKYIMLTDQYDLKREYPEYYWQTMANLLFTGKSACIFATYDYRFEKPQHKLTMLEVLPNMKDFDIITERIAAAVKMKLQILDTLSR